MRLRRWPPICTGTRHPPHDNGIATVTAELDEDSAVPVVNRGDSADRDQACQRAGARRRHRRYAQTAALQAHASYRNVCRHRTGIRCAKRTGASSHECAELGAVVCWSMRV